MHKSDQDAYKVCTSNNESLKGNKSQPNTSTATTSRLPYVPSRQSLQSYDNEKVRMLNGSCGGLESGWGAKQRVQCLSRRCFEAHYFTWHVSGVRTHTAGQSDWAGKAAAQFSSTALLWLREIPRRWFTSYYWSYHRPWLVIMKFDLIRSVTVHLCGVFLVAVPFIYWLLLLWNGLWFKWPALTFLILSRHIPYAMKLDPMSLSAQSASSVNIHTTSRETPHPIQNGVKSLKLYRVSRVSVWSVSLQQFRISWPKALYL